MLTDKDIKYIERNYGELYSLYKTGTASPEVWEWLKNRFPLDCWVCPRKVRVNISNLLNNYVREKGNRNTKCS